MHTELFWILWQNSLRLAREGLSEDFDAALYELEVPRSAAAELRERFKEALAHRLLYEPVERQAKELERALNDERRTLSRSFENQRDLQDFLKKMDHRIDERLSSIEDRLSDSQQPCRYAGADIEYSSYITTLRAHNGGPTKADALTFFQKLGAAARQGSVLALVDPYALCEFNDSGDKRQCIDEIATLVEENSITKLHLYCRTDYVTVSVWEGLDKRLKGKLSVHLGDLHDRYLIAGSDRGKGPFFKTAWHSELVHWRGVVFGASLNGVQKRPTYILPFEQDDLAEIRRYLDEHSKPTKLVAFKQARADRDAAQRVKPKNSSPDTGDFRN